MEPLLAHYEFAVITRALACTGVAASHRVTTAAVQLADPLLLLLLFICHFLFFLEYSS